jgi:hypothetical protein
MTSTIDADRFPERAPFADAVRARRPETGTWCEAWTVRDIVVHQAGNAEELARVLRAHLEGNPVSTRSFEEREPPFRALSDEVCGRRAPTGWPNWARSPRPPMRSPMQVWAGRLAR